MHDHDVVWACKAGTCTDSTIRFDITGSSTSSASSGGWVVAKPPSKEYPQGGEPVSSLLIAESINSTLKPQRGGGIVL
jgi:hypothetical protein